ncbi:hypothetical protein M501DRAFT_869883 [Patellaria atrata CBS 101060]|uniref:Heterokaryon incompatibility domain-containing protein n=1 Tax=Patellaria atrata CBS 101060 TaxID=1346257 RepID=A0A9P4S962_9PEZI|nr:hypothetical protein M501DRAFT_869883 [Patellaria atrata CBS 101060]
MTAMDTMISSVVSTSTEYQYLSLPTDRSFRLLKVIYHNDSFPELSYSLHNFSIDTCPPYNTLSYTWGNPICNRSDDLERRRVFMRGVIISHAMDTPFS